MLLQSLAKSWRRFWSSRLVKQSDVKGRHFTLSFKIYRSDDGEQTCRMSFHTGSDAYVFPMRSDELDRFIEAAQEARAQLGGCQTK